MSANICRDTATSLRKDNSNALQNKLIRHLNDDTQMSCFNFGLQFLDTEKMTYWGKRRDASFWIENASIEWNERSASMAGSCNILSVYPGCIPPIVACW
jgi:hypothetical protein